MFPNVFGQFLRKKISEMGRKEESLPTPRASLTLESTQEQGRENTAHPVMGKKTSTAFRVPQQTGQRVCLPKIHLGGQTNLFLYRAEFLLYLWHSTIIILAITSLAMQSWNNQLLGRYWGFKSNRDVNWVVFLSWQRKNLIETISDLQTSEVNQTIATVFPTAVTI